MNTLAIVVITAIVTAFVTFVVIALAVGASRIGPLR